MMRAILCAAALAALPLAAAAQSSVTTACTARVIDLRPITHYDHARGNGYLALRTGPGSQHPQSGELYLGDTVAVLGRHGNWIEVQCIDGLCLTPLWGPSAPGGWAYGRYLSASRQCL